jgi:hypothetical protein
MEDSKMGYNNRDVTTECSSGSGRNTGQIELGMSN